MITVSLETAKKLKEKGFDKYCSFEYVKGYKKGVVLQTFGTSSREVFCQAPTAQEILDELPKALRKDINLNIQYYNGEIEVMYSGSEKLPGCGCCYDDVTLGRIEGDNLTEVLALLRLRCKENNHLT